MAFPTSPSNNQVHKENNRAFVYDSALGVWDQVKESVSERLGYIEDAVDFPAGHVLQTVRSYLASATGSGIRTTSSSFVASGIKVAITPIKSNSIIHIDASVTMVHHDAATHVMAKMYLNSSAMAGANNYHVGYQASPSPYHPFVFSGKYTATTTNKLEFEIYYASGTSGQYARILHPSGSYGITATEVGV